MNGKKMRIAYVINSMEGGGAACPIPDIVSMFRSRGADVLVLALIPRDGKALSAINSIGQEVHVRNGEETDHLAAFLWLREEIRRYRATHIWTSLTRATLIGQLVGLSLSIPVVSWQHNAFLKEWNLRLLRWTKRLSRLWVADSSLVADLTCARLELPREKVITWPIFCAKDSAPMADFSKVGQHLAFCSLGRLHPAKGYDILVAAMALLKQRIGLEGWSVTIGGTGKDAARLTEMASMAGLANFNLVGYIDKPNEFLAAHQTYLQPSRREGFCIAAHEAMLAGLPAIVSQTGQMEISARACGGQVVPIEDVEALADAMQNWIVGRNVLYAKAQKARAYILEQYGNSRFEQIGCSILTRMATFD